MLIHPALQLNPQNVPFRKTCKSFLEQKRMEHSFISFCRGVSLLFVFFELLKNAIMLSSLQCMIAFDCFLCLHLYKMNYTSLECHTWNSSVSRLTTHSHQTRSYSTKQVFHCRNHELLSSSSHLQDNQMKLKRNLPTPTQESILQMAHQECL